MLESENCGQFRGALVLCAACVGLIVLVVVASETPTPASAETASSVAHKNAPPVLQAPQPDGSRADTSLPAPQRSSVSAPPETLLGPEPVRGVPVFLGGREVFRVRAARGGLDPERRAGAIRERLGRAVADLSLPSDSVRLIRGPEGLAVWLGPRFLWIVTSEDAAGADSASFMKGHAGLVAAVREGIARERASRRPARLATSALLALALTLLAWLLVRLLSAAGRRWRQWLHSRLAPVHPAGLQKTIEIFSRAQFAAIVSGTLGRLPELLMLVLGYGWLTAVLSLFPWTGGWGARLLEHAQMRVLALVQALWHAVPHLAVLALIVIFFRWLVALADSFHDAIEDGTLVIRGFHSELMRPSKRLTRILLWAAAGVVAFPYVPGSDTKAFQGISILLGVMVSLGSSSVVGNVIAGVVLTFSRSFRAGDRVQIGQQVGDVVSLGMFATKLRSLFNEDVTLPNAQVASGPIVNYTRLAAEGGLVLHTTVTVGYDVPWRTVHALLIEAAGRVKGVEQTPPAHVYQRSLDDFTVAYELGCVTHDSHAQKRLYSDLHAQIQEAFNRAGIELLSPTYHAIRNANESVAPPDPTAMGTEPGRLRIKSDG